MCHMRDIEYGVRVHLVCEIKLIVTGLASDEMSNICTQWLSRFVTLKRVENQSCRAKQPILVHVSLVVLGIVGTN